MKIPAVDQDLALRRGLPTGESSFDEVKKVCADRKSSLRPTGKDELSNKPFAFARFATTDLEKIGKFLKTLIEQIMLRILTSLACLNLAMVDWF